MAFVKPLKCCTCGEPMTMLATTCRDCYLKGRKPTKEQLQDLEAKRDKLRAKNYCRICTIPIDQCEGHRLIPRNNVTKNT